MIFFYIDESGTSFGDKKFPFFVMSAVAVDSRHWLMLDQFVHDLKTEMVPWAKPEDWELKGRDLKQGGRHTVFRDMNWPMRSPLILHVADKIASLDLQLFSVRVYKPALPLGVTSDADMYRVAMWALLHEANRFLKQIQDAGLLLFDSRSSLSSAKQDRRVIDAYQDWKNTQKAEVSFVELPWFGESTFYSGIQLADFVAYVIDATSKQEMGKTEDSPEQGIMTQARNRLNPWIRLIEIP